MDNKSSELDIETVDYALRTGGIIDSNSEIFKFLVTVFSGTVRENMQIELPDLFAKFKRPSLQTKGNRNIGQSLASQHFLELDIPGTFTLTNSGIRQIIDYVKQDIIQKIRSRLSLYNRDSLVIQMILLASVLSKITVCMDTDFIQTENDVIDSLIIHFNRLKSHIFFDPRVYLGELKSCLEFVVNELLTIEKAKENHSQTKNFMDFRELFELFGLCFSIFQLESYSDILPFMNTAEREDISFTEEFGIKFPSRVFEQFTKYLVDTRDEIVVIGDKKIDIIMEYLKKVKKYHRPY
ncbi:uncharacterized protein SRT_03680 [Streptococcus troglodytae]|uniref:Uncharacterized protein n=1 Tax=Streptococcus troglodytae TaxID=1111760 RepID=A0A1L7LHM1_9STRE|nr:hypothetical protein [Streptococcus troglodytae]BAQ23629.1 uncharacterized protein SRT_03680 [Streptococcus troglodytae]